MSRIIKIDNSLPLSLSQNSDLIPNIMFEPMKYTNIYKWNWVFHYIHCNLFMLFVWTHISLLLNERIFTSGYCLICTRRGNNDFIIFADYGAWFAPISPCPLGKSLGRQSGLPYAPRGSSNHLGLSSTGFGL